MRSSNTVVPIRTLSPFASSLDAEMRAPFTKVPLVEPRSSTVTVEPSTDSDAWRREASASSITSPALWSRPTTVAPESSNSRPVFGPSTTTSCTSATSATLCTGPGGSQEESSELRVDPVHHRTQLAALLLDLRVLLLLAHSLEVLLTGAVLGDPLARELPGLDLAEDVLHRLARRLGDDPLAARVVAVLGRVRDRVAHAADALLVHQVDDQLHLVEALEVREPGVVAGVHQSLVAGLHELAHAAAQHGLLAEEVSLR